MENKRFIIETEKLFSESMIWQLNRDYYNKLGINAWRQGEVPHQLSSNSLVGKTYAELIFAFLKDLAAKGQMDHKVYILELGAGHGRLAFHVLKHLEKLKAQENLLLPPYVCVLSDIVKSNLDFFDTHPQFQFYFENGLLDTAYFDAIESKEIVLRHAGISITTKSLQQPLLVIANYFFDSIPNDLFHFENKKINACTIKLETNENPAKMDEATLLNNIEVSYSDTPVDQAFYDEPILNEILEEYRKLVFNSYLIFPNKGLQCLENLKMLSQKGMMLISMDKGYHEIHDLENTKAPQMITHGSMSFWVNFHALGAYCKKNDGLPLFPSSSNFHLELVCLLLLPDSEYYTKTQIAYERYVNDFGPDDFNSIKRFAYKQAAKMELNELLGIFRLSAYDSTFFINMLPKLKLLVQRVSFNERTRLAQTMHNTWNMYFTLREPLDLAFEIGGIFYSLGYYEEALEYFQYSINIYGHTADVYYNRALCYFQLRQDDLFLQTLQSGKDSFPEFQKFEHLNSLDLNEV